MPAIRNSELFKRFTDFFKLKTTDFLDSEASSQIVPVVSMPLPTNINEIIDTSLNNSDKTLTVPSGKRWKLLYGTVELITTAIVGDRQFEFIIEDASGQFLYVVRAAAVQAASLTERYSLGQFGDVAQTVDGRHTIPIPVNSILPESFRIQILDAASIDPTADDMTIRLIVEETEVTGE